MSHVHISIHSGLIVFVLKLDDEDTPDVRIDVVLHIFDSKRSMELDFKLLKNIGHHVAVM